MLYLLLLLLTAYATPRLIQRHMTRRLARAWVARGAVYTPRAWRLPLEGAGSAFELQAARLPSGQWVWRFDWAIG
jgi:hypothetical protein